MKLYYDHLIDQGKLERNPAENVTIRGTRTKVISNLLSEEELEDLYYSYETDHHDTFFKATKLRDKVVVGLMVFQGITPVELYRGISATAQRENRNLRHPQEQYKDNRCRTWS